MKTLLLATLLNIALAALAHPSLAQVAGGGSGSGATVAPPIAKGPVGTCFILLNNPCTTNPAVPAKKWFAELMPSYNNSIRCAERAQDYKRYCSIVAVGTSEGSGSRSGSSSGGGATATAPVEIAAAYQIQGVNVTFASTNPNGHLYLHDGTRWILTGY